MPLNGSLDESPLPGVIRLLEATMNTWAIADLLRESAARVVVSNPLRTRAIAEGQGEDGQGRRGDVGIAAPRRLRLDSKLDCGAARWLLRTWGRF